MSQKLVKLRCEDCGGTMTVDEDREVISCPFCGSKKIFIQSDNVKIEKIKADVEKKKIDQDLEKFIRKLDKEEKDDKFMRIFIIFIFVIVPLFLLIFR